MRKIAWLAVAALFFVCTVTAYAQQPPQEKERNLIKIIQKSIENHPGTVKDKDKLKGDIAQVKTFQSMYDYIITHSAKARNTSLRVQSAQSVK